MPSDSQPGSPKESSNARLCYLKKSFPEQEYGFDLHADKHRSQCGQFIGEVIEKSPADYAGLQKGDRILAVNGISVIHENHKEVVKRIKEDPAQCKFVVLDDPGFQWFASRKLSIPIDKDLLENSKLLAKPIENGNVPASPKTNGSILHTSNGNMPHIEHKKDDGGMHISHDDVISEKETNFNVQTETHTLVYDDETGISEEHLYVNVTKCDDPTGLEQDSTFQEKQIFLGEEEEPTKLFQDTEPHLQHGELPRLCKLKKVTPTDEFGFNLHAEKLRGHFVGEVDVGSVAEKAGLIKGYRIVGVNGVLVSPKMPHKELVKIIKQHELSADLLIASPELDAMHAQSSTPYSFLEAEIFQAIDHAEDAVDDIALESVVANEDHTDQVLGHSTLNGEPNVVEASDYVSNGQPSSQTLTVEPNEPKVNTTNGTYNANGGLATDNDALHEQPQKIGAVSASDSSEIFRLSVSEMRERVLRNKKTDPRKESTMPIKEKYQIVQNL